MLRQRKIPALLARMLVPIVVGSALALSAQATVIDFEPGSGIVTQIGGGGILEYTEEGVAAAAIDPPNHFHIDSAETPGETWLSIFSTDSHGVMFTFGGGQFDLISLDTRLGGSVNGRLTSSSGATLDVIGSGTNPFATVNFAALVGWTDITWFTWTFASDNEGCDCPARLDNINLQAGTVPEPGSLALLSTAAVGLVALRRRRRDLQ